MTAKYPSTWRSLRFPEQRWELLEYLKEVAAVESPTGARPTAFDIDDLVHFLFDDTDIGSSAKSSIDAVLCDDAEQLSVRQFTSAVEKLIHELGDKPTAAYVAHPRWPEICGLAGGAFALLSKKGVPTISK